MKAPTLLALIVAGAAARADDPARDTLARQAARVQGQVLSEFRTVKDRATAQAARKNLVTLGREGDRVKWDVLALDLGPADREAFRRKLDEDLAPVATELRKEIARVSAVPEAIAVLDDLPAVKETAAVLEGQARDRAVNLEKALKTYILKNDGNPPQALRDVGRYLADPKAGLLDPWGREYQLGFAAGNGVPSYYVWTTSPFGGGTKRIESRTGR